MSWGFKINVELKGILIKNTKFGRGVILKIYSGSSIEEKS